MNTDHMIARRRDLILANPENYSEEDREWLLGRPYELAKEAKDKETIEAINALLNHGNGSNDLRATVPGIERDQEDLD